MSDLLRDGINLFNEGRYFDAHEVWEDLWRESGGPLRLFYQALVQAAVGMHHLSGGNLNGATAQLQKSLSKLDDYPPRFCEIDNEKLREDLRRVLDQKRSERIQIGKV